jgi:hypothetical protein
MGLHSFLDEIKPVMKDKTPIKQPKPGSHSQQVAGKQVDESPVMEEESKDIVTEERG